MSVGEGFAHDLSSNGAAKSTRWLVPSVSPCCCLVHTPAFFRHWQVVVAVVAPPSRLCTQYVGSPDSSVSGQVEYFC
eukprot:SAG31_NODE_3428_length_4289_cov_3.615990_1_plen_77_part_00